MSKIRSRQARKFRIRRKIIGTSKRPRLSVFKSNLYIYAQLIDDENSKTIAAASDIGPKENKASKIERAAQVGELLAKIAQKNKISKVAFDRSGYKYHGRIKALAQSARKGGLVF